MLRALEFTDGAFHVEVKYTSNGPRLIEVNARIGGGPIYELHRDVWDVDLVQQYLLTRLGVPIRPRKSVQPLNHLLVSYPYAPFSGVVTQTDFLTPIANDPRVLRSKVKVKAGQKVIGPDIGVPDWLAEIRVCGSSVEAANAATEEILARLEFPIERQ